MVVTLSLVLLGRGQLFLTTPVAIFKRSSVEWETLRGAAEEVGVFTGETTAH